MPSKLNRFFKSTISGIFALLLISGAYTAPLVTNNPEIKSSITAKAKELSADFFLWSVNFKR